jgi:hypothetical protein
LKTPSRTERIQQMAIWCLCIHCRVLLILVIIRGLNGASSAARNKKAVKSSEGIPWVQRHTKLWDEKRTRNDVLLVANKKVPTRVSSSLTAADARLWPTVEGTARNWTGKRINASVSLQTRRRAELTAQPGGSNLQASGLIGYRYS